MILTELETLLMPVFVVLLTLGMGATLSISDFSHLLRRPKPVLIGLASQYGWMPLIALGLALLLDLQPAVAVGLIIMGCCPGGVISNFFAYLARADLALSVSMTVVSTLTGFIMLPLLLFFYSAPFLDTQGDGGLVIPYSKIVVTLMAMLVPLCLGMLLRSRNRLWARRVEKSGSLAGCAVLILVIVNTVLREGDSLLQLGLNNYLAGLLLAPCGFLLGYFGARVLKLGVAQRCSVSLETGFQNAPLALAIILISFPAQVQPQILTLPILYAVAILPLSALAAWLLRIKIGTGVRPEPLVLQ